MTKPNTEHSRLPVVHIGMPKTATKTLQWRLFALHSEIFYLGRFDGEPFREKHGRFAACRDERVMRIMDEVAYKNIHDCDLAACRSWLQSYLCEEAGNGQVPVWSWESYCTDSYTNRRQRARNLKALLGEAKILATVRHPVGLLESAFLQQLKRDNVGAYFRRGKAPFYCDIDEWIARDVAGEVSNLLDYPRTIQVYVEEFGASNVCVTTFEDLIQDAQAFWKKICDFMGIDVAQALDLLAQNDDNSRWSMIQLERLRDIKGSPFKAARFRFASRAGRRRMLDLRQDGAPRAPGQKARVSIAPQVQSEILKKSLEGNRWLDKTFDLGLTHKRYLVS